MCTPLAIADALNSLENSVSNLESEDPNTGGVLLVKDSLDSLVNSTLSPLSRSSNTKERSPTPNNSLFLLNYSILSTILSSIHTTLDA